jgi:hypothetical protein
MIKFKDISDGLTEQEQMGAYILYFIISTIATILLIGFGVDMARGMWISLWGIPAGVLVASLLKPRLVNQKWNIPIEIVLGGALGFPMAIVYMLLIGSLHLFTFLDIYYFLVGSLIYELGLIFFYAFYMATDTLEQREYHLLATPIASVVVALCSALTVWMTAIYV